MTIGRDFLWLTEADVLSLLTIEEAITHVETAFRLFGEGKAHLPHKIYLNFPRYAGDLRAMPAYLEGGVEAAGVKIVNSHAGNPQKGLPAVSGVMVVVDPETGLVDAMMGAGNLTALRTGAAGGVAAKYLARRASRHVGLVGCGRQAVTQLEALAHIFELETVSAWGARAGEAESFCEKQASRLAATFRPCRTAEEACQADIVVTTTPSREPIVRRSWIKAGTHINAIGADAPGKQELEIELLAAARVFVDEWGQASHGGEINVAFSQERFRREDLAGELGAVVATAAPGRQSEREITVFDSTGLAIQDVAVAKHVVEKALKLKKGQVLPFHG